MLCMNLPISNISKSEVDCIKIDDGSEIQQQILLRILDKIAMTDSMQHPPPSSLLRNSSLLGHHRFLNKNLTIFCIQYYFAATKESSFWPQNWRKKILLKNYCCLFSPEFVCGFRPCHLLREYVRVHTHRVSFWMPLRHNTTSHWSFERLNHSLLMAFTNKDS